MRFAEVYEGWRVGRLTQEEAAEAPYSAFLVEEEGTMSSFLGVQAVIEQKGLFSSRYTDRVILTAGRTGTASRHAQHRLHCPLYFFR